MLIRESQRKFEEALGVVRTVDVAAGGVPRDTSVTGPGRLNAQVIAVLASRGVRQDAFLAVQSEAVDAVRLAATDVTAAWSLLPSRPETALLDPLEGKVFRDLLAGLPLTNEHLQKNIRTLIRIRLEGLRLHIPVAKSRRLFVIPDPSGTLAPGECYIHPGSDAVIGGQHGGGGGGESGGGPLVGVDVVGVMNPALHPGDARVFRAVASPELQNHDPPFHNVVVLSVKGDRPGAGDMGGGDYDGDEPLWIWDERLTQPLSGTASVVEPASHYIPTPPGPEPCTPGLSTIAEAAAAGVSGGVWQAARKVMRQHSEWLLARHGSIGRLTHLHENAMLMHGGLMGARASALTALCRQALDCSKTCVCPKPPPDAHSFSSLPPNVAPWRKGSSTTTATAAADTVRSYKYEGGGGEDDSWWVDPFPGSPVEAQALRRLYHAVNQAAPDCAPATVDPDLILPGCAAGGAFEARWVSAVRLVFEGYNRSMRDIFMNAARPSHQSDEAKKEELNAAIERLQAETRARVQAAAPTESNARLASAAYAVAHNKAAAAAARVNTHTLTASIPAAAAAAAAAAAGGREHGALGGGEVRLFAWALFADELRRIKADALWAKENRTGGAEETTATAAVEEEKEEVPEEDGTRVCSPAAAAAPLLAPCVAPGSMRYLFVSTRRVRSNLKRRQAR